MPLSDASHGNALCSEFPGLDPEVVKYALVESGGSVQVARTSLVATSWQQAGSLQKVGPIPTCLIHARSSNGRVQTPVG